MNTDINPPTAAVKSNTQAQPWRDVLPIHAAAAMLPPMKETDPDALYALGEDIKANGQQQPIAIIEKARPRPDGTLHVGDPPLQEVLDGISRLDAMELVGLQVIGIDNQLHPQVQRVVVDVDEVNPVTFVISANIHRRHLTAEKRRDLIVELLKATPEKSNRQIAETVKADHKTVGVVRTELESTGEIPQLARTAGKDGKARPARKAQRKDRAMLAAADRAAARAKRMERQQQQAHNHIEDGAVGHPEQSAEARKRFYESQDAGDTQAAHAHDEESVDRPGTGDDSDKHDVADRQYDGHADSDQQHDDVVDPLSNLGGEQDAPADKILTVGDIWGPTTPVQTIREEVLMEYFATANGAEIHTRIPRARRDEVAGEFLQQLSIEKVIEVHGKEWRARQPLNLVCRLRNLDNATSAETLHQAYGTGRFEAIADLVREQNAPKGGRTKQKKTAKLLMPQIGADDAGNPIYGQPPAGRSRAH